MTVALVGYTQATYRSSNSGTVAWPAGAAVGHLAVLDVEGTPTSRRAVGADGWTKVHHSDATDSWCKILTADDIASPLPVTGYVAWLAVYSGAGRAVHVSATGDKVTPGGRISTGSMLHVFGRGWSSPLTPATGKLGADVTNSALSKRLSNVWAAGPATTDGYLKLSGASNLRYGDGFEISMIWGPSAPTPLTPISGIQVDAGSACGLSWRHNSNQGVAQHRYQVRVREWAVGGAGSWSYLQADGTLGGAVAMIATESTSAAIAAGQLSSGTTYEWAVATEDLDTWSTWSTGSTFDAENPPTVESISVSAPAEDLSPTITATVTSLGAVVASRWVIVADSGGATVYDSGVIAGASLSYTVPANDDWTNGQTLRAKVAVRQEGGLWSALTADDATFAVTWTAPAAPSSVTAANQSSGPLVVTVAGVSGVEAVQVQASTDTGSAWADVATVVPSGSSVAVQRPQTYGVPVRFRARSGDTVDGVRVWSSWATMSADVTPTDTGAYLVADDGSDYLAVRIREDRDRREIRQVTVTQTLGDVVQVDSAPPKGWSGETAVATRTSAERGALLAWIAAHPVWIWHGNPEQEGTSMVALAPTRAALADGVTVARLAQSPIGLRAVVVPWVSQ